MLHIYDSLTERSFSLLEKQRMLPLGDGREAPTALEIP
jgi:hypothetical protein